MRKAKGWLLFVTLVAFSLAAFPGTLGGQSPSGKGELTSLGDRILAFLQSAAELLGEGLVRLINLVLPQGHEVGNDLVVPLGYLALLTLLLLLFGILEAARKVIWLLVGLGWVLIVVRIVIDAFAK